MFVFFFSLLTFAQCSLLFFIMKSQIHRDVFAKKYRIKLYFNSKRMHHKPLKVKILRPSDCDLVTLYISIFCTLQSLSRPFYFLRNVIPKEAQLRLETVLLCKSPFMFRVCFESASLRGTKGGDGRYSLYN